MQLSRIANKVRCALIDADVHFAMAVAKTLISTSLYSGTVGYYIVSLYALPCEENAQRMLLSGRALTEGLMNNIYACSYRISGGEE